MIENTVLENNVSSIIKKEEIPKLRFPEFDTLWKQISFSDIFDILQNNTYARADLNYKIENTKNIHYGDILVKFNEYVDVQNNNVPFINNEKNLSKFKSESYLRDGDIIIADTAEDETVGKVIEISNTNEQKVLSGLHTIPCRPKRKFAPMFLGFYMNSESFHKQLIPLITGIKVSSISKTSIATTTISVPLFEEQEKISKFMIAINNMIKEQESSISILETYNKGLISQIFKQEIRFKDDNGNEFSDWNFLPITEIATTYIGLVTTMTEHYTSNGVPLIRNSDIKQNKFVFKEPIYLDNEFARQNKTRQHKIGDIITVHTGDVGTSAIIDQSLNGSIGFATIVTRIKNFSKNSPQYICMYYNSNIYKNIIFNMITGDGRNNLNMKDFNKVKIPIPCFEEQEKIANFLSSLDNVLQEEKNYLEYLKTIKKGLLQQMLI